MNTSICSRAPGVVWRQAPDRVLIRRIAGRGPAAQCDLSGVAALLWLALDEPRAIAALAVELVDLGVQLDAEMLDAVADELRHAGWLEIPDPA